MKSLFSLARIFVLTVVIAACSGEKKAGSDQDQPAETQNVPEKKKMKTILFFGNSLTAAYGLDNPALGFAGLTQKRIDSLGLAYKVVNAGVSGETSAGGNSRVDWILKQPVDVFILELGGNDGLRGIPVAETRKNLQSILDKVKEKYPDAKRVLAGMQMPPSMGKSYTTDFQKIYPELAAKNNVVLIPFLLDHVGGEASLNLPDGIHPTEEGHKIVAETVWKTLKDVL